MSKDYYRILGLDKNAGQDQIKAAYRKLALQHHPDKNKEDPTAGERMKEINEAYAVLSNQEKRKKYDTYRASYGSSASQKFREDYSEEDIFRDSDIDQIFEEMSKIFGFRNPDEIFQEFYGSRYHTFTFHKPGVFGRGFIQFNGFKPQREPQGDLREQDNAPAFPRSLFAGILSRFLMRGVGKVLGVRFPEKGRDLDDVLVINPEQAQKGGEVEYSPLKWGEPRKIKVKVPPGIKEGQKIRLKGLGANGRDGGEAGDLYLIVKFHTPILKKIKKLFSKHVGLRLSKKS